MSKQICENFRTPGNYDSLKNHFKSAGDIIIQTFDYRHLKLEKYHENNKTKEIF